MKLASAVLAFCMATSTFAGPSNAAPVDPPIVNWSEMTRHGAPRAFMSLQDFAGCIAKKNPEATLEFLAIDFPSKSAEAEGRKLAGDLAEVCMPTLVMMFSAEYFRGALVEAAYHEAKLGNLGYSRARLGISGVGEQGLSPALGRCVVQRQPDLSEQLLATRISSPQQRKSFATLQSDIEQCVRQTRPGVLQPELLRFHIAEALYRDHAPRVSKVTQVAK
jgi:hypothetical protein